LAGSGGQERVREIEEVGHRPRVLMGAEPVAQVRDGVGRPGRTDRGGEPDRGGGLCGGSLEVVVGEGRPGECGVRQGTPPGTVLACGFGGGAGGEPGGLFRLVEIPEGMAVLAVQLGHIDEASPLGFVGQVDGVGGPLRFENGVRRCLAVSESGLGSCLQAHRSAEQAGL
jgi:hypothetical protein